MTIAEVKYMMKAVKTAEANAKFTFHQLRGKKVYGRCQTVNQADTVLKPIKNGYRIGIWDGDKKDAKGNDKFIGIITVHRGHDIYTFGADKDYPLVHHYMMESQWNDCQFID